jgi:chorismate synthase
MAGWIAEALLDQEIPGIAIVACVTRVGAVSMTDSAVAGRWTSTDVDKHMCRCPEAETASQIEKLLIDARKTGESYGGEIVLRISGVLPGLGEPVFGKIQTQLASAMASIGSVCSVSWNRRPTTIPGSEFHAEGNTYSGTSGGITTGDELEFRLEAKPVSTTGESALAGRHDPCVLPRIVPVVESMAAILLADLYLQYNARRLKQ